MAPPGVGAPPFAPPGFGAPPGDGAPFLAPPGVGAPPLVAAPAAAPAAAAPAPAAAFSAFFFSAASAFLRLASSSSRRRRSSSSAFFGSTQPRSGCSIHSGSRACGSSPSTFTESRSIWAMSRTSGFFSSSSMTLLTPSFIIVLQNGQPMAIASAPVPTASSVRFTLMR